jgi:hypothetical protein
VPGRHTLLVGAWRPRAPAQYTNRQHSNRCRSHRVNVHPHALRNPRRAAHRQARPPQPPQLKAAIQSSASLWVCDGPFLPPLAPRPGRLAAIRQEDTPSPRPTATELAGCRTTASAASSQPGANPRPSLVPGAARAAAALPRLRLGPVGVAHCRRKNRQRVCGGSGRAAQLSCVAVAPSQ